MSTLRFLISIALIAILISIVDIRAILHSLRDANLYLVLAVIIPMSFTLFLNAWRWQCVLKCGHISIHLFQLVRLYYINSYISSFLPGSWGGDLVRPLFLFRQYPNQKSFLYASVFFERICGLLMIVILATIGSIWVIVKYQKLYFMAIPAIFSAGIIFSLIVIKWASKPRNITHDFLKKIQARIANICNSIIIFTGNFQIWLKAFAISILVQSVWTLAYWLLLFSLGVKINIVLVFFSTSTGMLMSMLPISVAGIGVREGSIVYLLSQFGVNPEKASAAILIGLIPYLINALIGGIIAAYSAKIDGNFQKVWTDFIHKKKPLDI